MRRAARLVRACALAAALLPLAGVPASAAAPADTLRFTRTVFASGKDLPAPVAFAFTDRGVVYTANSLRYAGHGLFDVRAFRDILADDWTLTSVAARRAATQRWVRAGLLDGPDGKVTLAGLARRSEQVRRYVDADGDGRAERVSVFAAGMNELERGAAAGVLALDDRVLATVIPDLLAWRDSAGVGAKRTVLQTGFGLHMGQSGHDMHGLTLGLDGRLYWSIGDRGYAFTTREGRHYEGHSGAVFRCWPDGTGIERYATGLRNPQELAFDDHGDLFTGDNNADIGDRSRLLYVPEGSDAGWSYFLQFVPACGTWSREHEWEPAFAAGDPDQPAWVLHPAAEAGSCPSGFAAYPGTGLPARYDGTLWLSDFFGGVDAYRMAPDGAGFRLAERLPGDHDSWSACDVDFAPDGRVFVLYWGESWEPSERARLVALAPEGADVDTARVREVRTLLARGFRTLDEPRLAALLSHPDRRVRVRASLELARRGRVEPVVQVLAGATEPRARLHALWTLGMIARTRGAEPVRSAVLAALLQPDPEVRRVAATLLGELREPGVTPALAARLADVSPRVRFAAAQALARAGDASASEPLLAMLAANADRDPLLRMAGARALARVASPASLAALASRREHSLRLAAVLALREAGAPEVGAFLADADAQVACEAARAGYDLGLAPVRRSLALSLAGLRPALRREPYVRRALHAALREGTPEAAAAVAVFAADSTTSPAWREEALRVLVQWDRPDPRDGVWGRWEPQPPREPGRARVAVGRVMDRLFERSEGAALRLAVQLASDHRLSVSNTTFLRWVRDPSLDDDLRVTALGWLSARRASELADAVEAGLAAQSDTVFATALGLLCAGDPQRAAIGVQRLLDIPDALVSLQQAGIRALARCGGPEPQALLARLAADLEQGRLRPEWALDVERAAALAADPSVRAAAQARERAREGRADLARYALALAGGDAERGRAVFERHEAAACVRCHTLDGQGGTTGPDLSVVGTHDRNYLLEALVAPAATLAPGFTQSAMPPMGEVLTLEQLRDVIEYLATRRDVTPETRLGALTPVRASSGRDCVAVDRACDGAPYHAAGRAFAHGVGVIAPARIVYAVPAGSRALVGLVGMQDGSRGANVEFTVRVDGRLAWSSGAVRTGRVVRLYVPLAAGAQRVELAAEDSGANGGDGADWLEAGFTRRP